MYRQCTGNVQAMSRQCAGNVSIGKSLYFADRRRERQIARRIKTQALPNHWIGVGCGKWFTTWTCNQRRIQTGDGKNNYSKTQVAWTTIRAPPTPPTSMLMINICVSTGALDVGWNLMNPSTLNSGGRGLGYVGRVRNQRDLNPT